MTSSKEVEAQADSYTAIDPSSRMNYDSDDASAVLGDKQVDEVTLSNSVFEIDHLIASRAHDIYHICTHFNDSDVTEEVRGYHQAHLPCFNIPYCYM